MATELDRLVVWIPPAAFKSPEPDRPKKYGSAEVRWVAERFLKTYLEEWATDSLLLEWKWQHGQIPCPVPENEMKLRAVAADRLARVIADRAADKSEAVELISAYQRAAVDLLEDGSFDAAAALYRTLVEDRPANAEIRNNLGFCLMPTSPSEALPALEQADDLGYQPAIVNLANRAKCLLDLGRVGPAYALIEKGFNESAKNEPSTAWLWMTVDGHLKLLSFDDAREYLALLAVELSTMSGDDESVRMWSERAAELHSAD